MGMGATEEAGVQTDRYTAVNNWTFFEAESNDDGSLVNANIISSLRMQLHCSIMTSCNIISLSYVQ